MERINEEPLAIVAVPELLLAGVTALAEGLAACAASAVQKLQECCPEAFDEDGALRSDWKDIVWKKLDAAPAHRVPSPALHTELATRRITIHLN